MSFLKGIFGGGQSFPAYDDGISLEGNFDNIMGASMQQRQDRASMIDKWGKVADAFRVLGGGNPLNEMRRQAEADREMALQDHQRQVDAFNQKQQDDLRARIGLALSGLDGAENPGDLWPTLAEQAGIPADKAAAVGAALQRGIPAANLARALGVQPQAQGSLPAEIQNYRFRQSLPPEQRAEFDRLTAKGQITPYQDRTLRLRERQIADAERDRQWKRDHPATKGASPAASGKTSAQIGALQNMETMFGDLSSSIEEYNRLGGYVDPKASAETNIVRRIGASGVGQLVGSAFGTRAQEQRDKMESVANSIVQQMKTAYNLSAKDLDTNQDVQRALKVITNPASTYANAQNALDRLRRVARSYQQRLGAPQPAQPVQRSNAPAVGTISKGYRFKGGNPADRNSWVKVN